MLLIRTMRQVRTSSTIASFRACQTLSGLDLSASDRARAIGGTAKMLASEARRQWLIKQWQQRSGQRAEGKGQRAVRSAECGVRS